MFYWFLWEGKGRGVDEVNEAKKGGVEKPNLFWVMRYSPREKLLRGRLRSEPKERLGRGELRLWGRTAGPCRMEAVAIAEAERRHGSGRTDPWPQALGEYERVLSFPFPHLKGWRGKEAFRRFRFRGEKVFCRRLLNIVAL
ncbi:MAG: hypothetical protein ACOC1E_01900 [Marinilabiliaceae bacterium]